MHGQFPSSAQVQAEVNVVPEKDQLNENLVPELPAVRTAPRPALRPGQVNLQGQQDVLVFPSVTTTSALAITVFLDGAAIGSVRYPLAEVKATLRPTELRLGPGTTGGASPRARSPTSSLLTRRALSPLSSGGGKPPPSRHLSYSPPVTIPLEATAAGGVDGPPTLHMVWGELTFYDNRTSAVGWVDVLEEGGKAVNQRRLLVATPHSFTFMETPHCLVVRKCAFFSSSSSSSNQSPSFPPNITTTGPPPNRQLRPAAGHARGAGGAEQPPLAGEGRQFHSRSRRRGGWGGGEWAGDSLAELPREGGQGGAVCRGQRGELAAVGAGAQALFLRGGLWWEQSLERA